MLDSQVCGFCDALAASTSVQQQKFQYGAGVDAVILSVEVPVTECEACGLASTDWRGEEARAQAVVDHLQSLAVR